MDEQTDRIGSIALERRDHILEMNLLFLDVFGRYTVSVFVSVLMLMAMFVGMRHYFCGSKFSSRYFVL